MRALRMSGMVCGVVSVLSLSGCSLISASGLEECQTTADCKENQVCSDNLCLPLPTGCGTVYGIQEPGAIALGALFPVHSGTSADAPVDESDEQGLNATVLALDQINQRGVSGRHFTMYYCDTGNDANRARLQAEWMVKEKKVAAVITAGSGQTLAVAQSVTIPANVVTMSYSATSPELTPLKDTNGGPVGLVWRTAPSDAIQGTVIANLLRTDSARFGSPKRVGILYLNELYGQGLYNIVSEQLSTGTSIPNQGFPYARGDTRAAMDALNAYDPDLTVLVGFASDVTSILSDAAGRANLNRNVHKWLFSDSVKDGAVLANSSSAAYAQAQGFYGTAPAQGSGQAFNAFRSSFQSRFRRDPSEYAYVSNAYDSMYLLALGAAYAQGTAGEVTGPKIAEGLTKLSATQNSATQLTSSNFTTLATELAAGRSVNVDGASGALDFDNQTGEAPAPVELWQVNGGNFTTVSTIPAPKTTP